MKDIIYVLLKRLYLKELNDFEIKVFLAFYNFKKINHANFKLYLEIFICFKRFFFQFL